MIKKIFNKKNFYILGAIFIAWLFYYICVRTPIAGDDWGYAVAGKNANPFLLAFNNYFTWSGRFFSELWDFTMSPRKWLWNFINPFVFTLTYIGIFKLAKIKNRFFIAPLLIVTMMLTVENNLRMETYSWVVGSIFIIPMCLSVWYLIITENILRKSLITKRDIFFIILSNIFLFVIGMMMENIAAGLLFGIVLLIAYAYNNNRKMTKYIVINLIVLSISFAICRLSPGSAARLARDNADWMQLGLIEKLVINFPNFLNFTFIQNKYMVLFLGLAIIGLLFSRRKTIKPYILLSSLLIILVSVFAVFSRLLIKTNNIFIDPNSCFSMIFWAVYIIDLFVILFVSFDKGTYRTKIIFILLLAGVCSGAMLLSPVYGSRSALFTVYYVIVLTIMIIDRYDFNRYISVLLVIVLLFITFRKTKYFKTVYDQVAYDQERRLVDIEYYKNHQEVKEAWIKRFKDGSIHSIDVNPDDTYHMKTFKEYYQLPQNVEDIIFYYENEQEH